MPTLNINGNIRTNTAAGWAADATVYTAKTILITTDATYGTTDQRKFKIADGTQTWSNLDYFPVSGYDDATSSIQNQLNAKEPTITTLPISKGGTNSGTALNNGRVMISSAGTIIEGDTTTYPSTTELAYVKGVTSAIQTQLGNKQNVVAGVDDTEIGYLNGVTSAIQTQLDSKGFVMQAASNSVNPADGTTHSFADSNVGTSTTYVTTVRLYVPKACTLKSVHVFNRNAAGSAETGTFYVVKNGVTDITVSAAVVWTGDNTFSNSALNTSFAEGDWFNFKVEYPTWVTTNPTSVSYTVSLFFTIP